MPNITKLPLHKKYIEYFHHKKTNTNQELKYNSSTKYLSKALIQMRA